MGFNVVWKKPTGLGKGGVTFELSGGSKLNVNVSPLVNGSGVGGVAHG
jgi:hypothetical protein